MSGTGNFRINVSATGNQIVDGLLMGVAWGDSVVTFSFPTGSGEYGSQANYGQYGELSSFGAIPAQQKNAARWTLDTAYGNSANDGFSIEGFTNKTISYTTSANANIRYAESNAANPTAYAYGPGSYVPAGDVWFGRSHDYTSPQAGNYEWATLLHETGHAIGLKHGHDPLGNGALPYQYDSMEYSIMTYRSYIGQPTTGGYANETFGFAQSYMIADIAALQEMYGADYTTNRGNTIYSWAPGSGDTLVNGSVAINAGGNRIFATVWDGGGIDTYDLSAYTTGLMIDLTPGGHSTFSSTQIAYLGNGNYSRGNIFNALLHNNDTRSLIENAIGGSGNDTIIGNAANNTLIGGAGNDNLNGGAGDDIFEGGSGANHFEGGVGADTISYENEGSATVSLYTGATSGSAAGDTFNSIENLIGSAGTDYFTGNNLDNVLKGGGSRDVLSGAGGNDNLYGDDGRDSLFGNSGDDNLYGGNGLDALEGGPGADYLDGGAERDIASYYYSATGVTVDLAANTGIGGDAQGDTFNSIEWLGGSNHNDVLSGDSGSNYLFGRIGDDVLSGREGSDWLDGAAGDDIIEGGTASDGMLGGAGNDVFIFSAGDGYDVIGDFNVTDDFIDLSSYGITQQHALDAVTDNGQHVRISLSSGDFINLLNVDHLTLTLDNFIV